jgi:hypothetical protein
VLHDPETGTPFRLLPCERLFIRHAFAFDDDGRPRYTEWTYSGGKKTGKSTLGAMLATTALTLFGGRYGEGFVCANDLEQASSRVFEMIKRIIAASPLLAGMVKVTADRIVFLDTGSTIVALASDAASAAGGAPTISVFDELWGYTSERSRRFWDEMVPVPTRKFSVRLTVTYAGFDGESDLLQDLYRRGTALPEIGTDLRAGDGMLFFWTHDPVAPWQDAKWLAQMRRTLRPNQYLRMIENRWVAAESTFIDMALYDRCVDPELKPVVTDTSLPVWCAIDASVKHDSTALVAVTWDHGDQCVRLVNHRIIVPSPDRPVEFEAEVEATLLDWKRRYYVKECRFDPFMMVPSAQRLQRDDVPMKEFPQSPSNLLSASQNLHDLIAGRNLRLYPSEPIRKAISQAVAIEGPRGWKIGKDKQAHRIDVVIALGMACLGCVQGQANFYDDLYLGFRDDLPAPVDGVAEWRKKRLHPQFTDEEYLRIASPPGTWVPPHMRDGEAARPPMTGPEILKEFERWENCNPPS